MKFTDIVEELQKTEKRIILARCGVFMVAIGRDALFLNKTFGLKLSCLKPGICKVGIPLNYIFRYLDELEELGYGYLLYDYDKNTKRNVLKYGFEGYKYNDETAKCVDCPNCEYYKSKYMVNNINIFEMLDRREEIKNFKEGSNKDLRKQNLRQKDKTNEQ